MCLKRIFGHLVTRFSQIFSKSTLNTSLCKIGIGQKNNSVTDLFNENTSKFYLRNFSDAIKILKMILSIWKYNFAASKKTRVHHEFGCGLRKFIISLK